MEPSRFLGGMGLERRNIADATEREIDIAIRALVEEGLSRATTVLTEHRSALEDGARLLMERETLSAEDLPGLVALRAQDRKNGDGAAA
ncbi:hypothetical protein [Cereibacter sediminicola]|uniref:hypothetical protein n=1 Tax=Cereibacter sediminicola TaxID=2584941 RepID=UPI002482F833|nr:hypothetical protein [Cereibacter sediminicola]